MKLGNYFFAGAGIARGASDTHITPTLIFSVNRDHEGRAVEYGLGIMFLKAGAGISICPRGYDVVEAQAAEGFDALLDSLRLVSAKDTTQKVVVNLKDNTVH